MCYNKCATSMRAVTKCLIGRIGARGICNEATKKYFKCKLLIVGGGAAGCSMAWRFSRRINKDDILILEPSEYHYNQPLFALVAAGIKPAKLASRPTDSVLPSVPRLSTTAARFCPDQCMVLTGDGARVEYEHMVVAVGVVNQYEKIPGLQEALDDPSSGVSTIYSPQYCCKTWCQLQNLFGGQALFTFPRDGIKCSGAAQKIMYLADDYLRKKKLRHLVNITYNTGGESLFGVEKYNRALCRIAWEKCLAVNYCCELIEVRGQTAVFQCGDRTITLPFNFLHVSPPMGTPQPLSCCPELSNEKGYLEVDKHTLQHVRYPNVYGLGDCTSTPNSKTAAAVSKQSFIVEQNLSQTMLGKKPTHKYDGYSSCPIITSYGKGLLAEFGYDKKIMETFPFDQSKESRLIYYLKKEILPYIYWNKLIKGKFDGPAKIRKFFHPH